MVSSLQGTEMPRGILILWISLRGSVEGNKDFPLFISALRFMLGGQNSQENFQNRNLYSYFFIFLFFAVVKGVEK